MEWQRTFIEKIKRMFSRNTIYKVFVGWNGIEPLYNGMV
jgi:hypothetical protein